MPDETRRDPNIPKDETSPSVIFMELMRQAAARQAAQQPPAPPVDTDVQTETDSGLYVAPEDQAQPDQTEPTLDLDDATPHTRERLQAQRQRRVQRRRKRKQQQAVGMLGGVVRTFVICLVAAVLLGTILTWFTDADFLNPALRDNLGGLQVVAATQAIATDIPTIIPTPNWAQRIGVVSGHRGPNPFLNGVDDPGAVCPDGLTEASITFNTATTVVRMLRERGYTVDLLDEWDTRLDGYQAAALISIHANTCQDFGELVTGFIIASAAARANAGGPDPYLVECIASYYGTATGLQRGFNATLDMTDYHTFREIHPLTPAVIIELGYMLADRDVLTNRVDAMAGAIVDGTECFLQNGGITPTPLFEPVTATPGVTNADPGILVVTATP